MAKGFRIELITDPEFAKLLKSRTQSTDSPLANRYISLALMQEDIRTVIELSETIKDFLSHKFIFIKQNIPAEPIKKMSKAKADDLVYNINVYNSLLIQSLFTTIVITYFKWFSENAKGSLSMDYKQVFKNSKVHIATHNLIKDYRNSYFAHREENNHEYAFIMYYPKTEANDRDLLHAWPFKKREPTLLEVKKFNSLFKKTYDYVESAMKKMEPKVKELFIQSNKDIL